MVFGFGRGLANIHPRQKINSGVTVTESEYFAPRLQAQKPKPQALLSYNNSPNIFHHPDVRQIAVAFIEIQTIAHDEFIGNIEAFII